MMGGGEEILGVGCRKDWNGLRIRGVEENDGKGKKMKRRGEERGNYVSG